MTNEFPFSPRDYQLEGRFEVNRIINNGGHPLLVMPTGTGKTKTAAMIIHDQIKLGKIVFIVAPQIEIFDQLMTDYAFMNPGYVSDEGLRGRDRNLYICMALSLVNILSMIPESIYPQIVITDECHHSAADTWESIYTFFGTSQRIGMTATPVRTDNKPLGHLYSKIVEPITIREAINRGFLTEPVVIGSDEYTSLIPEGDDIDEKKQAEILGTPKIIGDVIEGYERVLNGKPMLIACCTHNHAKKVKEQFIEAGWIADHIHSGLSKSERKSMLNRVKSGKTNILCTVGVGIEGMDVSGLYGLAYLRPTDSTTIFVQFNGRPMRLGENKRYCFIFDYVGNCVKHGFPDRVRKWDLKYGEIKSDEEKVVMQKCSDCGVYNSILNTECHWCGCPLGEEGKLPGTCRRCKNWKKGECIFPILFNEKWMSQEGCEAFQKRGRSLPAMIDGKLVAITTDGEIHELKERVREKKEEIVTAMELEEEEKTRLESIDSVEKRKIVREGIFSEPSRRSLFEDAKKEWMEG